MELKKYRLGDIAEIIGGVSYSPKDICTSGIRILRGGNIQNQHIELKTDDVFLPISYKNNISQIYVGDTILVASTGSVDVLGKAATCFQYTEDVQIGAFLRIIRPKADKYTMLISSALSSDYFKRYIKAQAKGTSINNITLGYLRDFEIYAPHDFTGLSHLSANIENKICLNRAINDNLEAMAKQLYDYWFVQFDFPNEEGKPYKSSGGAMVWNEKLKREIPVGWSVKNLGQIATSYQQGLIRSNNQLSTDSKYGYLKMGDLDGKGQYTLQGLTRTNATNEEVDLYSLHKGDFLINVRNSKEIVGKTCLIGYVERNTLYNHMLVRLDFKDVSTFYMNLLFNSEFMYKALDGLKQGTTTVIALYQSDLYRLPILIPAPCVMERFLKITDSILDQKEIISHEIAELTKQRNELLPLLMNGQATVNYHLSDD